MADPVTHSVGDFDPDSPVNPRTLNPLLLDVLAGRAAHLKVTERGVVELHGEVVVAESRPLYLGWHADGEYEAAHVVSDTECAIVLVERGSSPTGTVEAGTYRWIDGGTFSVTTRDVWEKHGSAFALPSLINQTEYGTVLFSPTGFGDGAIPLYKVVDDSGRVCGLVVGGFDAYGWENRVTPDEEIKSHPRPGDRMSVGLLYREIEQIRKVTRGADTMPISVYDRQGQLLGYVSDWESDDSELMLTIEPGRFPVDTERGD